MARITKPRDYISPELREFAIPGVNVCGIIRNGLTTGCEGVQDKRCA